MIQEIGTVCLMVGPNIRKGLVRSLTLQPETCSVLDYELQGGVQFDRLPVAVLFVSVRNSSLLLFAPIFIYI